MRTLAVVLCSVAIILGGSLVATHMTLGRNDQTRVIFLDVGQGDGILITRGSWQVLIDGGASSRVLLEKLGRYMPFWDRRIDVMIATHPDADHIAAQIGAFAHYDIGTVIATTAFKKSRIATAWHSALERSRTQVILANEKVFLQMKKDDPRAGVLRVLFPRVATNIGAMKDINDTSIVTYLTVGQTTFLMMGDLSQKQEGNIPTVPVSILKAGHHGSKTSSGAKFIARMKPQEAVISVRANNRYGHPAQEVLARLRENGARIRRTDESGDIVYNCRFTKEDVCRYKTP